MEKAMHSSFPKTVRIKPAIRPQLNAEGIMRTEWRSLRKVLKLDVAVTTPTRKKRTAAVLPCRQTEFRARQ
jgi:hypothetical protein